MTIGEALKKERKELELSQTEMVGDVLTKSYYSKIERNQYEIKAIDLIKILQLHDIDVTNFFNQIVPAQVNNEEEKVERYLSQLHEAYYHEDLTKISDLQKKLSQEKQTSRILNLVTQATLIKAYLTNTFDQLSDKEKLNIRKQVFKTTNWDENSLRLFAIAMPLFDMNDLKIIIGSIFKKCPQINELPDISQRLIAAIAVNYLEWSFRKHNNDREGINGSLSILKKLNLEPKNCFAKIMEQYYIAIFSDDEKRAKEIKQFFVNNNMAGFIDNSR